MSPFGQNNESILEQINAQRRLRQNPLPSDVPPPKMPQPIPVSVPPPQDTMGQADAALFAAQEISQQRQANAQTREIEAADATQLLDDADRFDQNAAQAQAAAQDSQQIAQENRAQAQQLAELHQQEAQEDDALAEQAEEQARSADVIRISQDPAVVEQVKPDLAAAIGVDPKSIDSEVEDTFRNVQDILSGQLDRNNKRQSELARKLESGSGFTSKDKIALGMAALLPIIIGAATGNIGRGLTAAGQSLSAIAGQQQAQQKADRAELKGLEGSQLQIAKQLQSSLGGKIAGKRQAAALVNEQKQAIQQATTQDLRDQGIKLKNIALIEKAKQDKVLTKSKLADFNEKLNSIVSGKPEKEGKISGDQRKAATFSVRMSQAEDIFGVLEDKGFSPVEGEGFVANRLKREDRQSYEQSQRNFVNALLRRESGAAISEGEFESANQQYFSQPGDSAQVAAQKRANRAVAIAGLQAEAGDTAIGDIYSRLGNLAPVSRVEQSQSQVDFSQMSDEELQRIIQGGE